MGKLVLLSKPTSTLVNSYPRTDGVLLDPANGTIMAVKGYIQISDTIVLEPKEYKPITIGRFFFHTKREAQEHLLMVYEDTVEEFSKRAKALRVVMERNITK
jgi:hypothetical protein